MGTHWTGLGPKWLGLDWGTFDGGRGLGTIGLAWELTGLAWARNGLDWTGALLAAAVDWELNGLAWELTGLARELTGLDWELRIQLFGGILKESFLLAVDWELTGLAWELSGLAWELTGLAWEQNGLDWTGSLSAAASDWERVDWLGN